MYGGGKFSASFLFMWTVSGEPPFAPTGWFFGLDIVMVITMKLYELFLECFNYSYPSEETVAKMFGEKKLEELLIEICPRRCSRTKKLVMVHEMAGQLVKDLQTIERLKNALNIPESESKLPKITYSQNHKMDQLFNLRKMRAMLDKDCGFLDENGKSMYFNMPLTTCFHFYYKAISG